MPISQGCRKDPTEGDGAKLLCRVLRGGGVLRTQVLGLCQLSLIFIASFWLLFFPGWRRGTGTRRRTFAWIAATRDALP